MDKFLHTINSMKFTPDSSINPPIDTSWNAATYLGLGIPALSIVSSIYNNYQNTKRVKKNDYETRDRNYFDLVSLKLFNPHNQNRGLTPAQLTKARKIVRYMHELNDLRENTINTEYNPGTSSNEIVNLASTKYKNEENPYTLATNKLQKTQIFSIEKFGRMKNNTKKTIYNLINIDKVDPIKNSWKLKDTQLADANNFYFPLGEDMGRPEELYERAIKIYTDEKRLRERQQRKQNDNILGGHKNEQHVRNTQQETFNNNNNNQNKRPRSSTDEQQSNNPKKNFKKNNSMNETQKILLDQKKGERTKSKKPKGFYKI